MFKRIGVLVLAVSLCVGITVVTAAASDAVDHTKGESIKLKLTTGMETTHPQTLGMVRMGELLEERSGGRITFDMYDNAQLGTEVELIEQAAGGLVDAVATVTSYVASYSPTMAVFDLPYLFENEEVAFEVMKSDIWKAECDKLKGTGLMVITPIKLGFRNLTNSVRPVRVPEDVKGLKIRVQQMPTGIAMMEVIGAIPTPMAFPELYAALRQGTVDGQDNPTFVILNNSLDEVQPYISLTQHMYSMGCFVFSESRFNSMTPEDQAFLLECAADAAVYQIELAQQRENEATDKLIARGHAEVITEIDKEPWIEAMRACYPQFYDSIGKDLIDSVIAYNDK